MTVKNAVDLTRPQTNEDLYKITLYKEDGESTWWRAYEWSAYLTQLLPYDILLKPTRKHSKELDMDYVFVGLKMDSFQKYFPKNVNNINNKKIDIIFKPDECKEKIEDFTLDNYEKILNEWKSTIEMQKSNKNFSKKEKEEKIVNKVNFDNIPYMDSGHTVFSIINEIISYPLLNKTPIDNLNFISELQKHASIVIGNGK